MSSLIFYTDESQALVATDTLAVNPDGTPLMFCSKAIYLPHIRTIIAGTGLGMFSGDWANQVNNRFIVEGLRNLDYHTPDGLRALWASTKERDEVPESITTTVYQIGISEDDEKVHAFAYRSTNNFQSEPLTHGTRAKPECTFPEGNLITHLQSMMLEQRAIQESKAVDERIYIGGECVVMHLTKDVCTTKKWFRFDDYKDQLSEIFDLHRFSDA